MTEKKRASFTKEERRIALELTTEVAMRQLAAQRELRDQKTARLKAARFAAEHGRHGPATA